MAARPVEQPVYKDDKHLGLENLKACRILNQFSESCSHFVRKRVGAFDSFLLRSFAKYELQRYAYPEATHRPVSSIMCSHFQDTGSTGLSLASRR